MRAIIIQDHDASNLLDQLKLASFSDLAMFTKPEIEAWQSLPVSIRNAMIQEMHRKFHYIVCRWLQEQGANVVR